MIKFIFNFTPGSSVVRCALIVGAIIALPAPAMAEWHVATRAGNAAVIYTAADASGAGRPVLAIECNHGRMSVTIHWQQLMANSHVQPVIYSIDAAVRRAEQWRLSTDKKALGLWGPQAIPLARRLLAKRGLSIWAVNRRGKLLAANFKVDDLDRALLSVARACHWASIAARGT